jgi:serine/threonine protein phosphatase PrpC
LETSNKHR